MTHICVSSGSIYARFLGPSLTKKQHYCQMLLPHLDQFWHTHKIVIAVNQQWTITAGISQMCEHMGNTRANQPNVYQARRLISLSLPSEVTAAKTDLCSVKMH